MKQFHIYRLSINTISSSSSQIHRVLRILLFSVKITHAKYSLHKCRQSGWSFLCRTLQGQIKDHLASCTASQHLHANSEIGIYIIFLVGTFMLNQNRKKDIKSSLLVGHSHKITFSDINTLFSFGNIKYMCKKVYPYLILLLGILI